MVSERAFTYYGWPIFKDSPTKTSCFPVGFPLKPQTKRYPQRRTNPYCHMATGSNPVPVNIPIPTKIGSNMGGELTYPKMGSQNGFDPHPWLWVKTLYPGEHQNRWYMGVHPPQHRGIGYDPWPYCHLKTLRFRGSLYAKSGP